MTVDFVAVVEFVATFVALQLRRASSSRFLQPTRHTLVLSYKAAPTAVAVTALVRSSSVVVFVVLAGFVVALTDYTGLGGQIYICFGLDNNTGNLFY